MQVTFKIKRFRPEVDERPHWETYQLEAMNAPTGVWCCRKAYNCTDCCPRGIKITQHIIEVQRHLAERSA